MHMTPDQWVILFTGVPAVFLSQSAEQRVRRWACILGLLGQPAWLVAAYNAQQGGVMLISLLYTASWAKGPWTNWLKPWRATHA